MAELEVPEDEVEEGAPVWMATYSDLATLLLTFFVLMLSFANMDVVNFQVALGSVQKAMGVQFEVQGKFEAQNTTPIEFTKTQSADTLAVMQVFKQAEKDVQNEVQKEGKADAIEVKGTPRGLVVRMRDAVLFDKGRAKLKPEGKDELRVVEKVFAAFNGNMTIEGHTDNVPINTPEFRSNWELSAARSIAVLRYFTRERNIPVERLQIAGYADTKPLVPNDSEAARRKNRRVEFVFQYPTIKRTGKNGKMFDFKSKKVRKKIKAIEADANAGDTVAQKKGAGNKDEAGDAERKRPPPPPPIRLR